MVTTEQVRQQYFDAFSTQISDHQRPMLFVEFDFERTVSTVREWNFSVGFRRSPDQTVKPGSGVRPDWPNELRMVDVITRHLEKAWTRQSGSS